MVALRPWDSLFIMTPGTNSMLRARRKDKDVRPNRLLDRTASRGMLYENEELRLRTININADLEKGQEYIKKLRRENSQLRREIWNLRDQYDKLESMIKNQEQEQEPVDEYEKYDDDCREETDEPDALSVVMEENENDESGNNTTVEIREVSENSDRNELSTPETRYDTNQGNDITRQLQSLDTAGIDPTKNKLNTYFENETSTGDQYKMCSLNTCENFVNVFRKYAEEHRALIFSTDGFENLTAQEVIDCLEQQFGNECHNIVTGVRLTSKNCFISVNNAEKCKTLQETGLKIRDIPVTLDDVWERSTILQFSAVPHHVDDKEIVLAVSFFADVIGNVERQKYKGFDTGERFVHVRTFDVIPYQILLNSTCVPVTIIFPHQNRNNIARRKSFRSQININLKTPDSDPEGNSPNPVDSSQNNLRDTTTSKQQTHCFSKFTGETLKTFAEVENNIFQFPNSPQQQTSAQNASKKKSTPVTLSPSVIKDQKAISESPTTFRKFTLRHTNSIRKHNSESSLPPSPAPFINSIKTIRRPSVNFRNGPVEGLTKSRAQDGYLNEFGSGFMRDRSASDASSSRQSICRRKLSVTGHENSPKIPWCGCWGIGCC